LYDALR
jgi:hypothetical protein